MNLEVQNSSLEILNQTEEILLNGQFIWQNCKEENKCDSRLIVFEDDLAVFDPACKTSQNLEGDLDPRVKEENSGSQVQIK